MNRFTVVEILGWWCICDRGKMQAKFRSRRQALRVRDHLAGECIPDDSPAWNAVYAGVARDAGIELEGQNT